MDLTAAITVRRPPSEVYGYWRDFANFPAFMDHVESVTVTGPTRSHWEAAAPLGKTVEWDAEIVEDVPGSTIAWRSLDGAQVENSGQVRFAPAPGDQGTEVRVHLNYAIPGGKVGDALAKLAGENPKQQVEDDLRRFKQVLETGEVLRSDGSPEGTRARRQATQREAQPVPAADAPPMPTPLDEPGPNPA